MEAVNLGHSVKDIPVASRKEYRLMLINSYEKFTKNLRWIVLHFLKPNFNQPKETFGFKSLRNPPPIPETNDFEDELIEMIKNIEFETKPNPFQQKLNNEKEMIKNEPKLIMSADKTSNFYKVKPKDYKDLVKKNVEAEYRKEQTQNVQKVNKAHKKLVNKLDIEDRVFKTMDRECFVTLKDHKEGFQNNPKCRLLNPTKCELGKVSQQILTKKLNILRRKTNLNQWKNTYSVIEWFKKLANKKNLSFVIFDVVNYYPSITLKLLLDALKWASQFVEFTDEEIEIITETKKSLLYMNGEPWTKKGENNFDVAQGGLDSAEVCDLVGLFLLSELREQKLNANLGIFRDDGLGTSSSTPRQIEQIKKKICEVYRKHGLSITVDANKKVVQFLDVEFNLENETFKPFIKPNDVPLYVHNQSDHPPSVLKNIPAAINRRISALSSNIEMFESVAPLYQEALNKAGYNHILKYEHEVITTNKKARSRKRKILWFNPPYSSSVKTNVGAKFLKLIDKHFPKDNPLHKIINRKTTKISYRTTSNMKNIISSHNQKVIRKTEKKTEKRKCNCQKKTCPLQGDCLVDNLVYQATVKSDNDEHTYVGLASTTFKLRLGNHKKSFKNATYRTETTLSSFVWDLKDNGKDYNLDWKLIGRAQPFSPISEVCNLCTLEKYFIIFHPELATINKREEINGHCLHKAPVLLDKT